DGERKASKTLREGLEMLARQERRRHDDGNLLPRHCRDKGRAQCDFCLAETDVAANQTIHRAAGGEIFEHSGNCSVLILGFVVGKARTEFVIEALRRREFRRLAEFARGGDTYELRGNFTDAALELRFPRLPAHAA